MSTTTNSYANILCCISSRPQSSHYFITKEIDTACFLFVGLFLYTASLMSDYYCRDSELSYIGEIGFQSTPPLEGAGVFKVPEGDSPQNTEPPFIV